MTDAHGAPGGSFVAELGKEIGRWRRQRGLTQLELAERAGMSLSTVQRAEKSGPAKTSDTFAIAEALNIPLDVLVKRAVEAVEISQDQPIEDVEDEPEASPDSGVA